MDWKDVAGTVARSAPMLGGLLGGPPGAAVGAVGAMIASALGVGNAPEEVSQALAVNPDAAVKLKQIESDRQVELQKLVTSQALAEIQAGAQAISDVNKTMQAEAGAEHWPSYSWRPFIGFMFGFYIASMWLLPMFGRQPVAISTDLTLAIGGILGIASWFRGKMQADPSMPTINRG